MILIDAIYINNGGGKVLLDYLIEELEKSDLQVFYLLDKRIINNHPKIESNGFLYMDSSFIKRYHFYKNNKEKFEKVFCFGNVPPPIRLNAIVYTYFHQKLFLNQPENIKFIQKLVFKIKLKIVNALRSNTNYWLLQTSVIEKEFLNKFPNQRNKTIVLPFYPLILNNEEKQIEREKLNLVYVSNSGHHKNHKFLIDEFVFFYDRYKIGKLNLTISSDQELLATIKKHQLQGYPIFNHGFVERDDLTYLYRSCEFCIYPSLTESFGLGIIEAIENGCNVIGADLDYMHAICKPSMVFNPYIKGCVVEALEKAKDNDFPKTTPIVKNEINDLILLLEK